MSEAPTAVTPPEQTGQQDQPVGTITTGVVDLNGAKTVDVTAATVCTGTAQQPTPATDEQASTGTPTGPHDLSGPTSSVVAGQDVTVDAPGASGSAVTTGLPVLPNGTVDLDDPRLTATDVSRVATTVTDVTVGPHQPWDGYVGSSDPTLGTVVNEPGSTQPVGVDAGGVFTVPPDVVSNPGTIRIHLVEDALGSAEAPPWDRDFTATRQHVHWVLEADDRVTRGLAVPTELDSVRDEIQQRTFTMLAPTTLADDEKQKTVHDHFANVNTLAGVVKTQVAPAGTRTPVGQTQALPAPPKPGPKGKPGMTTAEKAGHAGLAIFTVLSLGQGAAAVRGAGGIAPHVGKWGAIARNVRAREALEALKAGWRDAVVRTPAGTTFVNWEARQAAVTGYMSSAQGKAALASFASAAAVPPILEALAKGDASKAWQAFLKMIETDFLDAFKRMLAIDSAMKLGENAGDAVWKLIEMDAGVGEIVGAVPEAVRLTVEETMDGTLGKGVYKETVNELSKSAPIKTLGGFLDWLGSETKLW